jgi:hypothetical protein
MVSIYLAFQKVTERNVSSHLATIKVNEINNLREKDLSNKIILKTNTKILKVITVDAVHLTVGMMLCNY